MVWVPPGYGLKSDGTATTREAGSSDAASLVCCTGSDKQVSAQKPI